MRKTLIFISFMAFVITNCILAKAEIYQRFCGKSLTDAMALTCKKGFNAKPLKRYTLKEVTNDFDSNSLVNDITSLNMSDSSKSLQYPDSSYSSNNSKYNSLPPHTLNRIFSKLYNDMRFTQTFRQRRTPSPGGIYHECCLKACKISELLAYCI
ncbi:insulin-like peptide 1 [Cochliomyia hominivorax]